MTKQEVLANIATIGLPLESTGEKIAPSEYSMNYKGRIFKFEVFQTKRVFGEKKFTCACVVAQGIDFYSQIDSILLFGSHSYIEEIKAYESAVLDYCKNNNLLICRIYGSNPSYIADVMDGNCYNGKYKEIVDNY